MTEKLANPPLVRAFCRFLFEQTDDWDWTIPGSLYEDVKTEYPDKEQRFGYHLDVEDLEEAESESISRVPHSVQFTSDDGHRYIEVGPQFLEIRRERSYPGWEVFRDEILTGYGRHRRVAEFHQLRGISLRYINRLESQASLESLDQSLTVVAKRPGVIGCPLQDFFQEYQVSCSEPDGLLVHRTGTASIEGEQFLMLDLEFRFGDDIESKDRSDIADRLDDAHDTIYTAFQDSLQEELFDQLKSGK